MIFEAFFSLVFSILFQMNDQTHSCIARFTCITDSSFFRMLEMTHSRPFNLLLDIGKTTHRQYDQLLLN